MPDTEKGLFVTISRILDKHQERIKEKMNKKLSAKAGNLLKQEGLKH